MEEKYININQENNLDLDNLDTIMELIGELLINKSRLESLELLKGESKDILSQLDRVTMELHHNIMKIRMISISNFFDKIKDKKNQLADNELKLNLYDQDVKIDRNIADKLLKPLLNYFANSLKRKDLSTVNEAEMTIRAHKEGNDIEIVIEDNWSQIELDKVDAIISEYDVDNKKDLASVTKEEKLKILFNLREDSKNLTKDLNGFLKDVTILKEELKTLNGSVKIKEYEKRISLQIIIPLTFAIAQALMVKIKEDLFAIPVEDIKETKRISKSEIKKVKDEEVIIYREQSIPLIDSYKCLNLEREADILDNQEELEILITNSEQKMAALIVDELLNQQDIVFKSMGELLQDVKNISGATIIGDGEIALILDINDII